MEYEKYVNYMQPKEWDVPWCCGCCPWCNGYRHREMDTATRVQILDEADYISHSTNTLGKGMNPIILPPAIGK